MSAFPITSHSTNIGGHSIRPILSYSSSSYNFLPPSLASFSSTIQDNEPMHNEQARGEQSQSVQRFPNVMADQETNKPGQIESTAFRLQSEASEVFGSRVKHNSNGVNAANSNIAIPKQFSITPNLDLNRMLQTPESLDGEHKVSNNISMPSSSSMSNKQFITFVPVQNNLVRQISLYQNLIDEQQRKQQNEAHDSNLVASSSRPERINVDWPAMTSDADYFPAGRAQEVDHAMTRQSLNGLQPVASRSIESDRHLAGSDKAKRKKQFDQLADDLDNIRDLHHNDDQESGDWRDRNRNAEQSAARVGRPKTIIEDSPKLELIQPQATRRGNSVISQMKLQFGQDYQAREGVPIYNNNVRVAGALDRQRALERAASISRSRSVFPSPPPPSSYQDDETDETRLRLSQIKLGVATGKGEREDGKQPPGQEV